MNLCLVARVSAPLLAVALATGPAVSDARSSVISDLRVTELRMPLITRLPVPDFAAVLPATAQADGLTEDWLMAQPEPQGDANWQCLTEAIYFESRGESLEGQIAVAEVILNRADSPLYPGSVCGVVQQRGGGGCQFSYVCDGHADRMREAAAADLAGRIARAMLDGAPRVLTDGATHFHSRGVQPGWSKRYAHTTTIGAHAFYRQPGTSG